MLPAIALEVLRLSRSSNVPFARIAALLEREPMLAGRILHIARSAAYGGVPVRTMNEALVRLGLRRMTDVLFEASVGRIFRGRGLFAKAMEQLRLHAVASAHLARAVCRYTWLDEEYAFLGGLLHDVGFPALIIAIEKGERRADQRPRIEPLLPNVLVEAHAEAGARVAELWGLPADLALVIRSHHEPPTLGRVHPLVSAVCLADLLATRFGFGPPALEPSATLKGAANALGITEAQWRLLLADAERVATTIT